MFFKMNGKILFRRYEEFGYLTDNSLFGYRFLNDTTPILGEKYVSASGAVMLEVLSKTPQDLDVIVKRLLDIFVDVEYDELKQDTYDFYMQLANEGYLSYGETYETCHEREGLVSIEYSYPNKMSPTVENCSKQIFKQADFLRSVHIEVASECNERCVHCYIPNKCKNTLINSELFYKIIEEANALNVVNITLSGGEPLLHKDFVGFLSKCRELGLSVNILTNLTLLTDKLLDEMKKNPLLSVQTSLYSMDPKVHDSITKINGSFEKTKNAILQLIAAGIPVQISCPIMKQNKDTFKDVIEWGNTHNVSVLFDYVIFAEYDRSNSNLVNRLSFDEVATAFERQLSNTYVTALCEAAKEKCAQTRNDAICSICRYYFCVSANGYAFPCAGWQTYILGDLNKSSMCDIWENSQAIQKLRQIKRESFSRCLTCEDRGYCTVCMMNNYNETGDMFKINDFNCKVAAMMRAKVEAFKNPTNKLER